MIEEGSGEGGPQTQRLLGWLDALDDAGIEATTVQLRHNADAGSAAVQVLDRPDRPTAVLCFSDVVAFDVITAARRLGLDVPGDVSVVGFDDAASSAAWTPPLTTVHQDVIAKGREATRALTAAIDAAREGDATDAPEHVMLPTELVVRDSTAPPRT